MAKKHVVLWAAIAALTFGVASCSEETPAEKIQQAEETIKNKAAELAQKDPAKAVEQAYQEMGKALSGGENIEPVDFRELKELMPKEVDGIELSNSKGQKTGVMGIKTSVATAEYANPNDNSKHVEINITDMGSMKGLAAMGMTAWMNVEIDKEDDNGYERTAKYKDFPTYEKYNSKKGVAEITLVVGSRYLISLQGRGINMDALKSALDDIDLGDLPGTES